MLTNRESSSCPRRALELLTTVNERRISGMATRLRKLLRHDALAHPGPCDSSLFQRSPVVMLAEAKLSKASGAEEFAVFVASKRIGARLAAAFDLRDKRGRTVAKRNGLLLKPRSCRGGEQPARVAEFEMRLAMLAALDSALEGAEIEARVNFKLIALCVALTQLRSKCATKAPTISTKDSHYA